MPFYLIQSYFTFSPYRSYAFPDKVFKYFWFCASMNGIFQFPSLDYYCYPVIFLYFSKLCKDRDESKKCKTYNKGTKNEKSKKVLKDKTEKRSAVRLSISTTSLSAKPIYLNQRHGTFQHGRGVRWKDHVPPQKHIKFISACETTPTECWQQTTGFQKGKPISSEWGRAKNKDKEETKDFETGPCTLGTELWRRKSLHTLRNPLMSGGEGGASESQRGAKQQVLGRLNGKYSSQRSL